MNEKKALEINDEILDGVSGGTGDELQNAEAIIPSFNEFEKWRDQNLIHPTCPMCGGSLNMRSYDDGNGVNISVSTVCPHCGKDINMMLFNKG